MGKVEKELKGKAKSHSDDDEQQQQASKIHNNSDDDDDVGNEDLSLEIVNKAMARASQPPDDTGTSNPDASDVVKKKKKIVKKIVKVVKKKKVSDPPQTVSTQEEEVKVGIAENADATKGPEADDVDEKSDNSVLRRLLRGPRYFDPPDKSWGSCYNCGEEGHSTVNCTSARRKKPCFICGSLEHEAKQCQKDCFICKGGGHRAKDCPKKYKKSLLGSEACLKCGASSHAMSACNNEYSPDDLKEIQCYVCKKLGHLCCANYSDALPSESSCYKCGQLGHNGQECRGSRCETSTGTPSSCFRCGEEGHFARECISSVKVKKRNRDLSTPTRKHPKENKGGKVLKSAPQERGKAKAIKKKKLQFDDGSVDWSSKSKRRGGWSTDDPGDFSRKKKWKSPSTPIKKHNIYSLTNGNRDSGSQYSNKWTNHRPETWSSRGYSQTGVYKQNYSASRFGNSSSDGARRNYDWW